MVTIKKIGVESAGKIFGLLYAVIGLIVGIIMSLISLVTVPSEGVGGVSAILGMSAIIIIPLIYGIIGFAGGAMVAFLYNLIADRIGGIEVETE